MMVAGAMMTQGDKDADEALAKDEFTGLADQWFDKVDPDKTGSVTRNQFAERFAAVLPAPAKDKARAAAVALRAVVGHKDKADPAAHLKVGARWPGRSRGPRRRRVQPGPVHRPGPVHGRGYEQGRLVEPG